MENPNPWLVVLLTVAAIIVLRLGVALVLSGGNVGRIKAAVRVALRTLRDQAFADKAVQLLGAESKPAGPPKPSGAPLRLLALLQRGDGRFLDFVLEDVTGASDEQIAAAVRAMQPIWQRTLREHLVLEPVRTEPEGSTVEVPAGFDPSAVLLTGNVTGQPPFRGVLKHPGWRVREVKLPPLPQGQDEFVIMPAEVELP
jgi:hypothetical protein